MMRTLTLALAACACAACLQPSDPIDYVDPFIGTGFHGHTYPGATTPFGMVQLSPDTRSGDWDACAGYHYDDTTIDGFSHTHLSGTGCADLGDILFYPTLRDDVVRDGEFHPVPYTFSHGRERAACGYYAVELPDDGLEVELTADTAELTFYVAYPIPAFADQGADGTIKDVVFTVDGTEYTAESDITTKPEKEFDTDAALFGISAGDSLPTQVLTVELPRDVLDDLEAGTVSASAYVNVFMNMTQNFFVSVTDLQAEGGTQEPGEDAQNTQDMQITANVEETVSQPEYTVTVPSSVEMQTLSAETDNTLGYEVGVKAENLNGTLTISAPDKGSLTSGENALAFTNSFGSQEVTEDTADGKLSGQLGFDKHPHRPAPVRLSASVLHAISHLATMSTIKP